MADMMHYAIHTGLPNLWHIFVQTLPFYLFMMAILGAMLGFAFWRDSKIVIRHYAFRGNLMIKKGSPTIYQGVHIIIPARSLDQAKALANAMDDLHEIGPTYAPEFRHG
jgi:putative lipoic acid-binding regulatory protein